MKRTLSLTALFLLLATNVQATERRTIATRNDCVITVGDRDANGADLVIATCHWSELSPDQVWAVASDIARHDEILSSVTESTALGGGRFLQVHHNSGISDRQVTIEEYTRTEGAARIAGWNRASDQEALQDGRVDPPTNDGSWRVEDHAEGGVQVTYTLRYDPGGRVPMWIVRGFQDDGIAKILGEMREAAGS